MSKPPIELTVRVTAGHIDAGSRSDSSSCPIARALADAWPGGGPKPGDRPLSVEPHDATIHAPAEGGAWTADLPAEATYFIASYDDGWPVEPFAFPARFEFFPYEDEDEEDRP